MAIWYLERPVFGRRALEEQKLEKMVIGPEYAVWECDKKICIDANDVDF
jgi:hypothetical protein